MSGSSQVKRIERTRLFKEQKGLCYYCQEPMLLAHCHPLPHPKNLATLDHIVPLSKGGRWSPRHNAVAACYQCNAERADKDARLFMLEKQGMFA